jgi:hypothetical protein
VRGRRIDQRRTDWFLEHTLHLPFLNHVHQFDAGQKNPGAKTLVIFGSVTGIDPRQLGAEEQVAHALNIPPKEAGALLAVSSEQLRASRSADKAMDETGETSGGLDSKTFR